MNQRARSFRRELESLGFDWDVKAKCAPHIRLAHLVAKHLPATLGDDEMNLRAQDFLVDLLEGIRGYMKFSETPRVCANELVHGSHLMAASDAFTTWCGGRSK